MKAVNILSFAGLTVFASAFNVDGKLDRPAGHLIGVAKCHTTFIEHVIVGFDRAGIIKTLECQEGSQVTRGAVLAVLVDDVAQANLASAEKKAAIEYAVDYTTVAKNSAEKELNRMEKINQNSGKNGGMGSVPLADIDKAKLAEKKAEYEMNHAIHELGLNQLNVKVTAAELETYSIRAGFEGEVQKVFKKVGEAVRQGEPVIAILNEKRVKVEGYVAAKDLRLVKKGARVRVSPVDADGNLVCAESLEGNLTFVAKVSDPFDSSTRVSAEIQNKISPIHGEYLLREGFEAYMEIEITPEPVAK